MRFHPLRLLFLLLLSLLSASSARAQAGVDALRTRLANQTVTIRIAGIRMSRAPLFNKVPLRIYNGVVQAAGMINTQTEQDEIMQPGDKVRVTKVDTSTDRKSDYVRLTVTAADGASVPLAFTLNKGQLATTDEPALEQVISAALDLGQLPPPPLGTIPPPPPPPDQPMAPIPPPPPPPDAAVASAPASGGWQISGIDNGKEARLIGRGVASGRADAVGLSMSCQTSPKGSSDNLMLRVRRAELADFSNNPFDCGAGPDEYNNAYIAVGSAPEQTVSICDESSDQTGPYAFQLGAPDELLRKMLHAQGAPMKIRIRAAETDNIVASFTLPADSSETAKFMDACFKDDAQQEKAYQATVVLSCPVTPGRDLTKMNVVTATGKDYHEPGYDTSIQDSRGDSWIMPKPTKAHPVVPKLTVLCTYVDSNASAAQGNVKETVVRLPVPAAARTCYFVIRSSSTQADCTNKAE